MTDLATDVTTASIPRARAVRRGLARARRAHATRTWLEVAEDAYVALFTIAMLGVAVGVALAQVHHQLLACPTQGCDVVRNELPMVAALATLGAVLVVLASLGPVVSGQPRGQWVLASPVDRGGLLRPAYGVAVLCAVVVCVAVPSASMVGTTAHPTTIGVVGLGGLGIGLLMTALATASQPHPSARRTVSVAGFVLLIAATVAAAAVAGGASWSLSLETPVLAGIVGAFLALGALAAALAATRVGRLSRADVEPGGALVSGLAGAAYGLDLSLVGELLTARRFRLLGARRSARGYGAGAASVAARELRRLGRSPQRLAGLVPWAVVAWVGASLGAGTLTVLLAVLCGYAATRWATGSLRIAWRSPGLRRALGLADASILTALAAPGATLAALWALPVATLPPGSPAVTWTVLVTAITSGLVRSAASAPPRFDGPLVTTPMGALPPGMIATVFRGPDAAVLGSLGLALGATPAWSIGLALVVAAWALWRASAALKPPMELRLTESETSLDERRDIP